MIRRLLAQPIILSAALVLLAAAAGWAADEHAAADHPTAEHAAGTHATGEGGDAAHDPAGHGDDHGGGEHGSSGIKDDLPFWGLVAFAGFLWAVKKLGWDSLTSGMREREATENRLIAEAEQLRATTADQLRQNKGKMESLDELIRETLAEAERDAAHARKDIRAAADKEAALSQQRAEAEIGRVQSHALHDLFATAADRIAERAEQRIREKLSAADQDQLIDSAVSAFVAQS